jgi:hypothetical protein
MGSSRAITRTETAARSSGRPAGRGAQRAVPLAGTQIEPAAPDALPITAERLAALTATRAAINAYIGGRVRQLRRRSGTNRAGLSALLCLTGQQVQELEGGHLVLSLDQAWLIARYFCVDPGHLFDGLSDAVVANLLTAAMDEPSASPDLPEWLESDTSLLVLAFARELQNCRSRAIARDMLQLLRAANRSLPPDEDESHG